MAYAQSQPMGAFNLSLRQLRVTDSAGCWLPVPISHNRPARARQNWARRQLRMARAAAHGSPSRRALGGGAQLGGQQRRLCSSGGGGGGGGNATCGAPEAAEHCTHPTHTCPLISRLLQDEFEISRECLISGQQVVDTLSPLMTQERVERIEQAGGSACIWLRLLLSFLAQSAMRWISWQEELSRHRSALSA